MDHPGGSHRVRTLIPHLNYSVLRAAKILPKEAMFTKIAKGGKFPSLAQKMGYSEFGLFMESIIRVLVENPLCFETLDVLKFQLPDNLQKYFKSSDYTNIFKLVKTVFLPSKMIYEPEWTVGPVEEPSGPMIVGPTASVVSGCSVPKVMGPSGPMIVGHPDLVYTDTIYDIKTTGRFNAMRSESILQILSYFCLAKKLKKDITKVGLVLPAQNLILSYDLSSWDWKPFWDKLTTDAVKRKNKQNSLYKADFITRAIFLSNLARVGNTVRKVDLMKCISANPNIPYQFFVGGNCNSNIKLTAPFKKKLKAIITKNNTQVYIHAPYNLNLSKPRGNFEKEGERGTSPWVVEKTIAFLNVAAEMSVNGVVIHAGRIGDRGKKNNEVRKEKETRAVEVMYKSVVDVINGAKNLDIKLLIETSSGQDGEVLCSPNEMCTFYLSSPKLVRDKVGLCVDTCHVFAAGYNPINYIKLLETNDIPIHLIHYNDSKMEKGTKRDRHAPVGYGFIGLEIMSEVLNWAIERGVPCVRE